ncbi:MAG: hypothetical protein JWR75_759 [Devosia sp.]|nr:hypothetical protein [Devosia sp.]
MLKIISALTIAMLLAVPLPAFAAGEGTAVGVDPDALANLGTVDRILTVGADVSVGERIVTGPAGKVQIVFADQTKLVVGPGSALLIEDYLLRGDDSVDKVTINALAGTFRFVTGNGPKDAYAIKTPNGTIGVRGTAFDLNISEAYGTLLLLLSGAVDICDPTGVCVAVDDRCAVSASLGGQTAVLGSGDRAAVLAGFPFSKYPSLLLGDFRINGAQGCIVPQEHEVSNLSQMTDSSENSEVRDPDDGDGDGDGNGDGDGEGNGDGGDNGQHATNPICYFFGWMFP